MFKRKPPPPPDPKLLAWAEWRDQHYGGWEPFLGLGGCFHCGCIVGATIAHMQLSHPEVEIPEVVAEMTEIRS